jgi:hypothetical protein
MSIILDGTTGITLPGANTSTQIGSLTSRTSVATTSGTAVNFTNIPSWVTRITIMFVGVSTSGTSDIIVQLGTSGGIVSSGYLGSALTFVASASPGSSALTSGFLNRMGGAAAAAATRHGSVVLSELGNNIWVANLSIGLSDAIYLSSTAGSLTLASILTQLRITTVNGTDTFDAGAINIMYE